MQWLQDPQAIRPQTAMPNLGVGEEDARDIAAYLYAPKTYRSNP
jgi:cytochrome c1